jgi:hypothetical protein
MLICRDCISHVDEALLYGSSITFDIILAIKSERSLVRRRVVRTAREPRFSIRLLIRGGIEAVV